MKETLAKAKEWADRTPQKLEKSEIDRDKRQKVIHKWVSNHQPFGGVAQVLILWMGAPPSRWCLVIEKDRLMAVFTRKLVGDRMTSLLLPPRVPSATHFFAGGSKLERRRKSEKAKRRVTRGQKTQHKETEEAESNPQIQKSGKMADWKPSWRRGRETADVAARHTTARQQRRLLAQVAQVT